MRGLDRKRSGGEQSGGEQLDSKQEGDARARSGFGQADMLLAGVGSRAGSQSFRIAVAYATRRSNESMHHCTMLSSSAIAGRDLQDFRTLMVDFEAPEHGVGEKSLYSIGEVVLAELLVHFEVLDHVAQCWGVAGVEVDFHMVA